MSQKKKLLSPIKIPFLFVTIMWIVKLVEIYNVTSFSSYGILPRYFLGLQGILFSPFIHADFSHLLNNTYPLIILGWLVFYFYNKIAIRIFLWIFFIAGIWLWAIGRADFTHIGASGIIYGLASFIFFSGVIKKRTAFAATSLLVVFLYGSMIWGILPINKGISWEGHLAGLFAGLLVAIYYKNEGPKPKRYQWEIDEEIEKIEKTKTNNLYKDI